MHILLRLNPLIVSFLCLSLLHPNCSLASEQLACGTASSQAIISNKTVAARERLLQAFDQIGQTAERRKEIADMMDSFESRLHHQQADATEIDKTYNYIIELLEGHCEPGIKAKWLAEQIIEQSASPTSVNQGRHNTCGAAALEERLYYVNPSLVARTIKEAALTGSVLASTGQTIRLTLKDRMPDREANIINPGSGLRSYASQLFQLVAINAYWQQQNVDPRGTKVRPGQIIYVQKEEECDSPTDTGERLIIDWGQGLTETVVENNGEAICHPLLDLGKIKQINKILTGDDQTDFFIANRKFTHTAHVTRVNSEASLRTTICSLAQRNRLPAMIAVHTSSRLFNGSSSSQRDNWHVVNVIAYVESTGRVSLDNWWGDHSPSKEPWLVDMGDLYASTIGPQGTMPHVGSGIR